MAKKEEAFYAKLVEKMVRENKSILVAANELELPFSSRDLLNIERRKPFQQALWAEKNKYYKEIASDPERNKNVAIGQLTMIVDELIRQGKLKEAADAILKLAKVEGWVGSDTSVNVFGNLNDADLQRLELKVTKATDTDGKPRPN